MICPRCGSRDTIDRPYFEKKLRCAECLKCQYEWEQEYNPFLKDKEESNG